MKKHLCIFVNYQQNNWLEVLVMAKFAANNNKLTFTKLFPFFATKGLLPHINFDIIKFSDSSTHEWTFKQKALDISRTIESTLEFIQKVLQQHNKVSQSNQTNIRKILNRLMEIKSSYLLEISSQIKYLKSQILRYQAFFSLLKIKKVLLSYSFRN